MNAIKVAAYHESAHIVISHYFGFSSEYVRLNRNGDGEYKIDFGEFADIAAPMMIMDICPELFSQLSSHYKNISNDKVSGLAKQICYILISGGIAENIAYLGKNFTGRTDVQLAGPDLTRASAIAQHFSIDLDKEMNNLYEAIREDQLWIHIEQLATTLLASDTMYLSREEICQSLNKSGFREFLLIK